MTKYLLLLIALVTLMVTWAFSTQSQGGLRFAENEKLVVHPNSILRKLLLKKDNQDYPLRIYKVIPWVINMVLFLIVLLVYAVFAILYQNPTGLMIKGFLESAGVQIFSLIWCLLNFLYIGIINALQPSFLISSLIGKTSFLSQTIIAGIFQFDEEVD